MTLPAARIAKLVPLLGSDKEGEVAAAVRGIRRILREAGHDLHDLAAHLAADRSLGRPHHSPAGPPRFRYLTTHERLLALQDMARLPDLSAWEWNLICSIAGLIRMRPDTRLSAKQLDRLDALLARTRKASP